MHKDLEGNGFSLANEAFGEGEVVSDIERFSADKKPFCLHAAERICVELSDVPLSSASFVMRINACLDMKHTELLSTARFESALLSCGWLSYGKGEDGHLTKLPTETGIQNGVLRKKKRLIGGGESGLTLLSRKAQSLILARLNALVGGDSALDREIVNTATGALLSTSDKTESAIPETGVKGKTMLSKNPGAVRTKYDFCWNCESKVSYRYTFKCPVCGWSICPKCGVCRHPRSGGCRENSKGLARFSGLLKAKNEVRTLLLNTGMLDTDTFSQLCKVNSPSELERFRSEHESAFSHINALREEKKREQESQNAEKVLEIKRNQRGFYKIVSKTSRFITYISASGIKKTILNRPPVKVGSEYIDLSAFPESER